MTPPPPTSTLFPYTTLFRSRQQPAFEIFQPCHLGKVGALVLKAHGALHIHKGKLGFVNHGQIRWRNGAVIPYRLTHQTAYIAGAQTLKVGYKLSQGRSEERRGG